METRCGATGWEVAAIPPRDTSPFRVGTGAPECPDPVAVVDPLPVRPGCSPSRHPGPVETPCRQGSRGNSERSMILCGHSIARSWRWSDRLLLHTKRGAGNGRRVALGSAVVSMATNRCVCDHMGADETDAPSARQVRSVRSPLQTIRISTGPIMIATLQATRSSHSASVQFWIHAE